MTTTELDTGYEANETQMYSASQGSFRTTGTSPAATAEQTQHLHTASRLISDIHVQWSHIRNTWYDMRCNVDSYKLHRNKMQTSNEQYNQMTVFKYTEWSNNCIHTLCSNCCTRETNNEKLLFCKSNWKLDKQQIFQSCNITHISA